MTREDKNDEKTRRGFLGVAAAFFTGTTAKKISDMYMPRPHEDRENTQVTIWYGDDPRERKREVPRGPSEAEIKTLDGEWATIDIEKWSPGWDYVEAEVFYPGGRDETYRLREGVWNDFPNDDLPPISARISSCGDYKAEVTLGVPDGYEIVTDRTQE
ncbi:MAG: hypothetical protein ABEJ72_09665 [Candidatus Aenigmatarchaeota archaeon]